MLDLPIHPKSRAIYEFLVRHAEQHRLPPTRQEIAEGAGIASTGTVQRHLLKLAAEGRIQLNKGMARAIFVVRAAAVDDSGRNQS